MKVDIILGEALERNGESMLSAWFAAVGETVAAGSPLLEISTGKTVIEVAAPASGVLAEQVRAVGDPVREGELLGRIATGVEAAVPSGPAAASATPAVPDAGPWLSPAARRLVREHGVDPARITGTGVGGRVTAEDIERHLAEHGEVTPPGVPPPLPGVRRVPHSPLRRAIARHMTESVQRAPHATALYEADLTAVVANRERHRAAYAAQGVHLSFTPYFLRAAVIARDAVPEVNSRWSDDSLDIYEDMNIGFAVEVPSGILVPVIRSAQRLDLLGLARETTGLTERARSGRFAPNETEGGTLTVTNHGMGGSLMATPILHQPQCAILGVGRIQRRPVVVADGDGERVAIRPMVYLTLTIDHRALDGMQANRYMSAMIRALESWPLE
jgi:2-oxoglutarate dehydrogenase E2 component (dihydrolipoamide succinyltransferase)